MKTLSEQKFYPFTDFIRYIAMTAIIFQHSFIVSKQLLETDHTALLLFFFLKVLTKIGSISFFIVSGFLLSSALHRNTTKEYLNKRMSRVLKPYALFVLIYLLLDSAGAFFGAQKITDLSQLPAFIAGKLLSILFYTSYWFIFNYFISVAIILVFRKYLYTIRLGVFLFFCTLVYSVNVHAEWFPPSHTTAFLGFVFFLWLGANIEKCEIQFWSFIDKSPYGYLLTVALMALGVSFFETVYLLNKGATIPDGSLNITNIVYCLAVFCLLCKVGRRVRFRIVNPRIETYPLYLVHPIFLKVINYALLPLLPTLAGFVTIDRAGEVDWLAILMYQMGWFIVIYSLSLSSVKLIMQSRFRWVFGKPGVPDVPPAQSFKLADENVKSIKFR